MTMDAQREQDKNMQFLPSLRRVATLSTCTAARASRPVTDPFAEQPPPAKAGTD